MHHSTAAAEPQSPWIGTAFPPEAFIEPEVTARAVDRQGFRQCTSTDTRVGALDRFGGLARLEPGRKFAGRDPQEG
jgi:hypothetical protein